MPAALTPCVIRWKDRCTFRYGRDGQAVAGAKAILTHTHRQTHARAKKTPLPAVTTTTICRRDYCQLKRLFKAAAAAGTTTTKNKKKKKMTTAAAIAIVITA